MSEVKPRASMAQAKEIWDNFEKSHPDLSKSIRHVSDAIAASGLSCAPSTLGRWIAADFMPTTMYSRHREVRATIKVKQATQKAQSVSEKLSESMETHEAKLTRVEMIEREEAEMKAERIRLLSECKLDSDLAALAMRESLIAQIVLARQITRRAAVLMEVAPEIAADLMRVLKGPAASTTIVMPPNEIVQGERGQHGDGAKVIDGRVLEKSASQLAIEAFKARRSQGVAA